MFAETQRFANQLISLLPDLGRRWREATNEGWRSLYCTNDKSTFYYNILITSAFSIAKSRKYDIIIKKQRRKVKKVPFRSNLIERR